MELANVRSQIEMLDNRHVNTVASKKVSSTQFADHEPSLRAASLDRNNCPFRLVTQTPESRSHRHCVLVLQHTWEVEKRIFVRQGRRIRSTLEMSLLAGKD